MVRCEMDLAKGEPKLAKNISTEIGPKSSVATSYHRLWGLRPNDIARAGMLSECPAATVISFAPPAEHVVPSPFPSLARRC